MLSQQLARSFLCLFSSMEKISLAHQEIQNIHSVGSHPLIQLCITASRTSHCNKTFVLNIEQFGKISSRRLKLIAFIMIVSTFRAPILNFFVHFYNLQIQFLTFYLSDCCNVFQLLF